jgi:hypothetical protein
VLEEGHARRCAAHEWILNEKRLLDGLGLEAASDALGRGGAGRLVELVDEVAEALGSADG